MMTQCSCGRLGDAHPILLLLLAQEGAMAAEQQQQQQQQRPPCASPGNPVFSCMLGPEAQAQALLYRTTSGDYGRLAPGPQAAPCKFCPRENAFTNHLLACGRAPRGTINTGVDRGRALDRADALNAL